MKALATLIVVSAFCAGLQLPQAHYRHAGAGPVLLPDSAVTPGVVATSDTAVVCHRSTTTVRHTTQRMKNAVYAAYGIRAHHEGQYEIDHLIPLELGGADTVANLWPQPAAPVPGFHQKDWLENHLHELVCAGRLELPAAQRLIAADWYGLYLREFGEAK
ncbi:MAG TPA: hypothetical protein VEU74_12180 [Gemmatimonadales bacterium]|nr:hypothetical protein [Gemmatimonadales bacterium]